MITNFLKAIYVNTKVRCEPRNTTNFNQKVKIFVTVQRPNFFKNMLQCIKKIFIYIC